jgi:DNA-directed RNA polymerase subunit RPC12/RpoP
VEVSCPQCGNRQRLSLVIPDEQGLLRLTCENCGKRLLLKVSRPDLKLEADETDPVPLPKSLAPESGQTLTPTVGTASSWALHVAEFPAEFLTTLRAALKQIPRYSRNPNKVFDMTVGLPYQFDDLTFKEVSLLEACLTDCGARYRTTPET